MSDTLCSLIDVRRLPGQDRDLRGKVARIEGPTCGQFLVGRTFDANRVREALAAARVEAVIPPKSNRRFPADFDRDTCKIAAPDRGFLRETQGIQRYRHALQQDRHKLQRGHRHRSFDGNELQQTFGL
ncbi:MAG: hypothetical protein Q7J57_08620 [Gemmobacter sp.]|nr:hypothetical protein [Gemmobacter sp.]